MSTTEQQSPGRQGQEQAARRMPSRSALHVSSAIRAAVAVVVAGGCTAALIIALWGPLNASSDVIGYPIFSNFNPYNYSRAYYLVVGFFPVLALVIFFGLTWLGPRVGLAAPAPRGRVRPLIADDEADPSLHPEPSVPADHHVGIVARMALVGATLGIEVGIASSHLWRSIVLVTAGYCVVVALVGAVLGRLSPTRASWPVALATVNALGAPLTIVGLMLVSAHTEVRILEGNLTHRYPWFPAWVAIPLTAGFLGVVAVALRRGGVATAALVERRATLLIAAPVALFLLVAHLPGDLGQIGLFEQGQNVAETMLLGHGFLPWRDVVLTHGLLGDVAPTAAGWAVFGNSYWGAYAGLSFLLFPLTIVSMYFLFFYLLQRSWPLLLLAGLIYVGSWFGSVDPRFVLWPLVLVLLAALLRRSTRPRAVGLGLLVVAQGIATPEMAPGVLIAVIVAAAYEWYWRAPETAPAAAFERTIRLVVVVAAAVLAFAIYVASRGALGDVIYVTVNLVTGHTLDGAIPPQTTLSGVPQGEFLFIALAPVAALLISFAYAVTRLRLRQPFLLADWPMAAAALFVLFYYTKFLARMDIGHAYQPFTVALPLMVYIVYRVICALENEIRRRLPDRWPSWVSARPVAVVVLIYFIVAFWSSLRTQVEAAPVDYRPVSATPVKLPRVGYSSQVDGPAVQDLRRIIDAYLRPKDRLMDITDEPALFYYFLGRNASSRWYAPNGIVDTPELQRDLISELRRARPKLIVFDDTDAKMYGLPAMDGVPVTVRLYLVSRWILSHYRPLLESHGRTIYALPGVRPISTVRLGLQERPRTTGVRFLGQPCAWGYSPTFLGGPAQPASGATSVPARATSRHGPRVTFTGWAGDLRAGRPAREVIATFNGKVISRTTPGLARPDVPKAGYPAGFRRSGFHLSIPTSANASAALRVLEIGRDGSVAQLLIPNQPPPRGPIRIGGRSITLRPKADTGRIDGESSSGGIEQVKPPAGSRWSDYRWLEIDAHGTAGFLPGGYLLSDVPGVPVASNAGHVISFATLPRSPRRYILPVASCQQWRGFGSHRLFLTPPPGQQAPTVRLIR